MSHKNNPATLPAILFGGPPHSGKSVLIYSVSQALRQKDIPHYVLRACPDGEGDWSNETAPETVREIRVKGAFTPAFVADIEAQLENRVMPLLVDVGGKPRPWQETIFTHCTAAILLIQHNPQNPATYEQALHQWREMMARHSVPIVAELASELHGRDHITQADPVLHGTISQLERNTTATGVTFDALVNQLTHRLRSEIVAYHRATRPTGTTWLNLDDTLAHTWPDAHGRWQPSHLTQLTLPPIATAGLALYGRLPNWVIGYIVAQVGQIPLWQFDARLGWVQPPLLPISATPPTAQAGWTAAWTPQPQGEAWHLSLATGGGLLDIHQPDQLPLPPYPPQATSNEGVIISGRLPHWLLTAVVRHLLTHTAPRWLAIYQPPLNAAVVIWRRAPSRIRIGDTIPIQIANQ